MLWLKNCINFSLDRSLMLENIRNIAKLRIKINIVFEDGQLPNLSHYFIPNF
jgi:hypothetical protein